MVPASFADRLLRAHRLYDEGRLIESEREAGRLLALAPDNAELLALLASMAHLRGDGAQTTDYCVRAANAPGATAVHWNSLGLCRLAVGDAREAAVAFERASSLDPSCAVAFNNLGLALQQLGNRDGAEAALRQAVRLDPKYSAAHCNLGEFSRRIGRNEEATTCFETALRTDPRNFRAIHALGMVHHERGDVASAIRCYREALRIQPDFHGSSNNLGAALKELGQFDAAIAQFRKTLSIAPHHPLAIHHLSQLAAEGLYAFEPKELRALEELVAAGQGSARDRSVFCFALAAVHDAEGSCDEAFAYCRMANELRKESLPVGARFDCRKHQELVERVIRRFDVDYFRRVRDWGVASDTPIFIVGMPRSGSTLVEQILATDPRVFAAGELGEISRRLQRLCDVPSELDLYRSGPPFEGPAAAQEFAGSFLNHLDKVSRRRAPRVTVKTLENLLHLGAIATAFPAVRIVHCVRDPLDVCVSCYFQNFAAVDFSWDLGDIAHCAKAYERLADHWRQCLPTRMHEVRYEELVREPEVVTRDLFRRCGLEWDASCLRFFENAGPVRTASSVQVRKPLSAKSIGRWQRYAAHLTPLFEALGHPPAGQTNQGKAAH